MNRRIMAQRDQEGLQDLLTRLCNVHELRGGRYETDCPVCGLFGLGITPRPGGYDCRCSGGCPEDLIRAVIDRRPSQVIEEKQATVCLSDVQAQQVSWMWLGYIPFGMLTLISGDPGQGKGTLCIDLAARLSRGLPMPHCQLSQEPANVLLLTTAEDDLAVTIRPRLEAAGADLTRIHAYKDIVSLPEGVEAITQKVKECKVRLVIIDPLNAYLSGKIDAHKDQDVRRALSPLKQMAEETGAAVIIVAHLNKGSAGGPAIYRGGGSIGIVGAARIGLLVGTDPQDPARRVFVSVKCNVGPMPPALSFTLENDERLHVGRVEWGDAVTMSADELLSWRPPSTQEKRSEQAEAWYRDRLADGAWHKSDTVEADRQAAGISTITAKRARKEAGIVSKRKGFGAGAVWYVGLPEASGEPFDKPVEADHRVSLDTQKTIEYHPSINDTMILYGENGTG